MSSDESDIDLNDSNDEESDAWVPESDDEGHEDENEAPTLTNRGQNNRLVFCLRPAYAQESQ